MVNENKSIDWPSLSIKVDSTDLGLRIIIEVYLREPPEGHYFIIDDRVTLTLKRADNDLKILDFPISFRKRYLTISSIPYHVVFVADINQAIIKTVEKMRKGQDLKAELNTQTVYGEVDRTTGQFKKVNYLYISSARTSDFKTITAKEWIEKVLKPAGYGERLILEIPFTFPEFPPSLSTQNIMSDFRNNLNRAIEELNRAYDNYLNYRNDDAVDRVRESLDAFRGILKDNKTLLQIELLEKTSTCSRNISEEIFNSFINIIDSLYNVSSKGLHAVNQKGELHKFRAYSEDSEALICGLLSTLIFFAKKYERRLQMP